MTGSAPPPLQPSTGSYRSTVLDWTKSRCAQLCVHLVGSSAPVRPRDADLFNDARAQLDVQGPMVCTNMECGWYEEQN